MGVARRLHTAVHPLSSPKRLDLLSLLNLAVSRLWPRPSGHWLPLSSIRIQDSTARPQSSLCLSILSVIDTCLITRPAHGSTLCDQSSPNPPPPTLGPTVPACHSRLLILYAPDYGYSHEHSILVPLCRGEKMPQSFLGGIEACHELGQP